jgi:Ca-activated chloride channel family protein
MIQEAVRLSTVDAGKAKQTLQIACGMTMRVGNSAMTQVLTKTIDELERTGSISKETAKTVYLGSKTRTVRLGGAPSIAGGLTDEEIRKRTGL